MFLRIRSLNHTAKELVGRIETKVPTVLRLGSVTPTEEIFAFEISKKRAFKEINTALSCKISGDKIKMKEAFINSGVITAEYTILSNSDNWNIFPAIIKHKHSSKGENIYYITNNEELIDFKGKHANCENYIIEKYYMYAREYRLHVTNNGCFYACRKMLKTDAKIRWHRHENNSVWILEENPDFNTPTNWDKIVTECIKAKNAVGLDIAAIDIKVQTSKHDEPKFIILETNSAPSLGEIGVEKYINCLKNLVNEI